MSFESVLHEIKKGATTKIICVGDSITFGQNPAGGSASKGYPEVLQGLVQQLYNNASVTVVNEGTQGNTSAQILARLQVDVLDQSPDLIVLNAGANDSREASGITIDQYRQNMVDIIDLCGTIPVAIMGVTPRFKEHETANGEGVCHFYRLALQSLAAERGIPYSDTFGALMSIYKSRAYGSALVSSDGSHYSDLGYQLIAGAVFADLFANDDIRIKPEQFKDCRGQWISTTASASNWGYGSRDSDSLVIESGSVDLFIYLDDFKPCSLVVHSIPDCSNGTDQKLSVNDVDYSLSPELSESGSWYAVDYPINTISLSPGLNVITLSAATSARITGFSALPLERGPYLGDAPDFFGSADDASGQMHSVIGDGYKVLSNGGDYVTKLADLIPDPDGIASRWRIRAAVAVGSIFYFGQQGGTDGGYAPVFKLEFTGSESVVSCIDNAGVESAMQRTSLLVFAAGEDIRLDLESKPSSFKIWINSVLVFSVSIPLSVSPVYIRNINQFKRMLCNAPIKKGRNSSNTGAISSEQYRSFIDNKLHLVNQNGVDQKLSPS